jgi:NADPH2 dehydrogenase
MLDMGMPDPQPTFETLVKRLDKKHPNLAFVDVVDPDEYGAKFVKEGIVRSNDFIDSIRLPRPVVHANGFNRESALKTAEKDGVIIGFARHFLANPDLPMRLEKDRKLAEADEKTFYTHGAEGYLDYPFASEGESEKSAL